MSQLQKHGFSVTKEKKTPTRCSDRASLVKAILKAFKYEIWMKYEYTRY